MNDQFRLPDTDAMYTASMVRDSRANVLIRATVPDLPRVV